MICRQLELLAAVLIFFAASLLLLSTRPLDTGTTQLQHEHHRRVDHGDDPMFDAVSGISASVSTIRSASRAVICKKNDANGTTTWKPTMIFIAGLEGCGHHGIVPLFRDLPGIILIERAEQILTDFWDPTVSIDHRIKLREKLLEVIQEKFDACVASTAKPALDCGHYVLFGKANFFSYPYDSPRGTLRHPDLMELIDIVEDESLGARFDLKILVLHRQPYKMVQSNLRRKFVTPEICKKEVNRGKRIQYKGECDGLLYLAREAEMSMTYFNSELSALSAEYFRVVDYSQLVQFPVKYAALFTRYLKLDQIKAELLEQHMKKKFRGHVNRPRLLRPDRDQYLSDLFSPTRRLRWQLIDSREFDLDRADSAVFNGAGEHHFGYQCIARS